MGLFCSIGSVMMSPKKDKKEEGCIMDKNDILSMPACCFTGHRPKSFPWKKSLNDPKHVELFVRLEKAVDEVIDQGIKRFIAGNALGVDTWAAEIVLKKKEEDPSIMLEIAVPFSGHNSDVAKIQEIQKRADLVHVVSSRKGMAAAYYARNQYMVDSSEAIIAVYDAAVSPRGGTANTFADAKKNKLQVFQIKWADLV